MKKLVVALSALAAFTGSALAADMAPRYSKAPPPPVAAVANWTGCYVGGGGGYGLWNQENTSFDDGRPFGQFATRTRLTETVTTGGRGYFGTVQGGCDYQFSAIGHQFVIGVNADYDFSDLKGNHQVTAFNYWSPEKMSSAWAAGGRIGWLAFPQLLTYFSAGYTEATFDRQTYTNAILPPFGVLQGVYTPGKTYKGFYIGAGDEYALGFLPGLFWKTEYRFSQFDAVTNPILFTVNNQPSGTSEDSKKWVHTIRSELVYRFNWGGPLVAKY